MEPDGSESTGSGIRRQRSEFPHFTGGAGRDRTDGLLLAKQALSQLSYGPDPAAVYLIPIPIL